MHTVNIMLVDDHDLVRTGIRRLVNDVDGFNVVAEASTGEEAITLARQFDDLHVVLMDINMPGIGGLEATKKLLHYNPDLKIIGVTMHDDDIFPQRLLKAGAKGYLTKGSAIDEIVHAIREVMANRHYICPDIAQQLAIAQALPKDDSPFESLSERELQVMLMLMSGDKVNSISSKLSLSPKTISTYRHRLYTKLGVQNDMELAKMVIQHGIVSQTKH